ncbi:MAG TPA: phage tail protein [Anaerolineae bacterium]|nr:phage tail protein [Anaerolineae bacterium]
MNERLYHLLPAIYRVRDAAQGEPLRALLAVVERELQALETDVESLYDNWFIETCAEWVVPYIGDLLGVRGLHEITGLFSQRAYVANTLAYRRRKGTAAVLEQLARDVTGWPARVVEFFQRLATTQHLNHVRPDNLRTPDLRDTSRLELLGGPFEGAAYSADVRRIANGRGKHNLPNVGVFLWRLQPYTFTRGAARAVASPADGRFTFNPLGLDAPLFNRPQTEVEITHLAEEINVPGALRRRALYDELEARRQAIVEGNTPHPLYFGETPVWQVFVDAKPAPPEEMLVCDLSDWRQPPATKAYRPAGQGAPRSLPIQVAVDPVLGRLTFPQSLKPETVEVSYTTAFSGDLGGGPYSRRESVAEMLDRPVAWQMGVQRDVSPASGEVAAGLGEALEAWNAQPPGTLGVIAILDSQTYEEDLKIAIPAGSQLLIVAAHWPEADARDAPGPRRRIPGEVVPEGLRPHLLGEFSVQGAAGEGGLAPGALALNGLLIEGKVVVKTGNLGRLRLAHCTLAPGRSALIVKDENTQLEVSLERSISGPIALADGIPKLRIVDSIVDAAGAQAISAPGAMVELRASTVLGKGAVQSIEAGECIFTDALAVERRQTGCIRFCYVADGSSTPRRYRCQPDLGLESVVDPAEQNLLRARSIPAFTSLRYGDAGYAQLARTCADEIRAGAEDGAEMGAFNFLKQPQREANLRLSLDEYLRFGLEAGIFYVT